MQSELSLVLADSDNPFFKSKYADLAACWDVLRGPLTKNGLSIIQLPSGEIGKLTLTTILAHSSGQSISTTIALNPAKNDAQSIGSILSYFRRYSITAITGLAQTDDDAEIAMDRQPKIQKEVVAQKPKQQNVNTISEDERLLLWNRLSKELKFEKDTAQEFLKSTVKKDSLKALTKDEFSIVMREIDAKVFAESLPVTV